MKNLSLSCKDLAKDSAGLLEILKGLGTDVSQFEHKTTLYSNYIAMAAMRTKLFRLAHPEEAARRKKRYCLANKEKISASGKLYYQRNRKKILRKSAAYYWKNKERFAQTKKAYCFLYPERVRERDRIYYYKYHDRVRAYYNAWQNHNYLLYRDELNAKRRLYYERCKQNRTEDQIKELKEKRRIKSKLARQRQIELYGLEAVRAKEREYKRQETANHLANGIPISQRKWQRQIELHGLEAVRAKHRESAKKTWERRKQKGYTAEELEEMHVRQRKLSKEYRQRQIERYGLEAVRAKEREYAKQQRERKKKAVAVAICS